MERLELGWSEDLSSAVGVLDMGARNGKELESCGILQIRKKLL